MRRWLPALLALVVLVGFGTFLRFGDKPAAPPAKQGDEPVKLVTVNRADVAGLSVAGKGYRIDLRNDAAPAGGATSGPWQLVNDQVPAGKQLDANRVEQVVAALAPLSGQRVADRAENPQEWGLDAPTWTLSVTTKERREHQVRIGAHNPAAQGDYAQVVGDAAVYLIDSGVLMGLPETRDGWFQPVAAPAPPAGGTTPPATKP